MSMGTEGTPTADAPGGATTPPAPGALALLVATAVGGLVGARLGSKPLMVAAGATALAWLNRKTQEGVAVPSRTFASPSPAPVSASIPAPFPSASPFPPAPPVAAVMAARMPEVRMPSVFTMPMPTSTPSVVIAPPLADPRIEDWLARQMAREEHAAVLDLESGIVEMPAAEITVTGGPDLARLIPEDDYTPESLLLENFDEEPEWRSEAFTGLSEPVVVPPPVALPPPPPAPVIAPPVVVAPFVAAPVMMVTPPVEAVVDEARPVFTTVKSASTPDFAGGFEPGANPWGSFLPAPAPVPVPVYVAPIPEIEPLPSWNEAMGTPPEMPLPPSGVELESLFTTPVFQGATLPDEIQMNPIAMPTPALMQEDPLATLFKPYEPAVAATPEVPAPVDLGARLPKVREIEVQISAPGDAWFDSPLAGIPNPWGPPPVEEPEMGAAVPPSMAAPANVTRPVVDAEIVLRPRAPVQASVVPKVVTPPAPVLDVAEPEAVPAETEEDGLPSAPVKSAREQRARTTWRSWWRGD